jgi:hypothetical protein
LLFAASPVAAKTSNPAFLGVGMHDAAGGGGPCEIDTVTKDSGADAAGLRPGDVFVAIDGNAVVNCNALVAHIQTREPGQTVKIDVRRGSGMGTTAITAKLHSRADVMRQRVVGQPLPLTTLVRVEDESTNTLSSRGKTTIVGWFDQSRCVGCETVFGSLEQWARNKSTRSSPISVVGATAGNPGKSVPENVEALKPYQRKLEVPLLVADHQTFSDLAITDSDRIHFMVIDCRGVVQYVAPLLPDADDKTAVLDELFAATEQAARRLK